MARPFWTMMTPTKYYNFRRQTLINWIDCHSHMINDHDNDLCHYCNRSGDELWWYLPMCLAHNWHIKNMIVGRSTTSNNPYRSK